MGKAAGTTVRRYLVAKLQWGLGANSLQPRVDSEERKSRHFGVRAGWRRMAFNRKSGGEPPHSKEIKKTQDPGAKSGRGAATGKADSLQSTVDS